MTLKTRKRRTLVTGFAMLAFTTPCSLIWAQDMDAAPPDVMGMPRNIVPAEELPPPEKSAESPPEMAPDMPAPPPVLRSNLASPVQIGELATLEGPVAGTLDSNNGSLGVAEWQGSDRATMVNMLQSVPAATPSATQRLLMRKLLLTPAPPPAGRGNGSFNQLRLGKLLDGGYLDDAATARRCACRNRTISIFSAHRPTHCSMAGRDNDACSDLTAHRLDSAETFWVELRAYCYIITNDTGPLDLRAPSSPSRALPIPPSSHCWTVGPAVSP